MTARTADAGLRLGEGLVLPVSFATEGVVALGMRGAGKSNTLVRWAEVLYGAGIPFVAIDPKGDWGGIRSSADGTKPGLSVAVFGGIEETFPLTASLGAAIADLLVDHNLSAVLDISRLSKAERGRFLTDFCHRLMDRHKLDPHVRCVILEEAHHYLPQQVTAETARVKEAAAAILLEGRAFGLGCWAASQRAARLHKDVLEEVGTAVLHRIGAAATNDLRTAAGWVKHEELSSEIVPSLNKLRNGEAWILAPAFGITQRVMIDRRTTYDSASTPRVGAGSRPTLTLADVDATAIKEALAETIEHAKANDPRELRRRIATLERQLAAAHQPEPIVELVDVPLLDAELVERVELAIGELRALGEHFTERADVLVENLGMARALHDAARDHYPPAGRPPAAPKAATTTPAPARPARASSPSAPAPAAPAGEDADGVRLKSGARRLLATIARQYPMRLTRAQVGTLAGFKISGGTFGTYFSTLRRAGFIVVDAEDLIYATEAGLAEAGVTEPDPMSAEEVLAMWRSRLKRGARQMLDVVVDAWPAGVARRDLAEHLGMAESGGTFGTYLSTLRRNGLVDVVDGIVTAGDALFLDEAR